MAVVGDGSIIGEGGKERKQASNFNDNDNLAVNLNIFLMSFFCRAVWVDLTGDGRKSILTARAKLRKVQSHHSDEIETSRPKNGQLVWLEMPKPHHFCEDTGTPLEEDGTAFDPFSARHLPWKER